MATKRGLLQEADTKQDKWAAAAYPGYRERLDNVIINIVA